MFEGAYCSEWEFASPGCHQSPWRGVSEQPQTLTKYLPCRLLNPVPQCTHCLIDSNFFIFSSPVEDERWRLLSPVSPKVFPHSLLHGSEPRPLQWLPGPWWKLLVTVCCHDTEASAPKDTQRLYMVSLVQAPILLANCSPLCNTCSNAHYRCHHASGMLNCSSIHFIFFSSPF